MPREVCWVPEKRGTFREFIPSPGLRQAVVRYVQSLDIPRDQEQDFYLFSRDRRNPASCTTLRQRLKRIARRAGVPIIMHPHAFRHTLVGKLIEVGNSMEQVSKYMGHKSVDITERYYYISTAQQLNDHMILPFTEGFTEKRTREAEDLELMTIKRQKAVNLLRIYQDVLDNTGKHGAYVMQQIKTRVRDLDEGIAFIES